MVYFYQVISEILGTSNVGFPNQTNSEYYEANIVPIIMFVYVYSTNKSTSNLTYIAHLIMVTT